MYKKINRVGIYLRLSDEDKNKENKNDDSESIKNQRNLLLEEINKRDDFVLIDEYCDEDLSGVGTYRPEFERLINDCKDNKLDVVLCKSQSRFSRDMEIIEKYIHNKFLEWNIRFISIADNADTNNVGNKKTRQINGLVNEWYLEDVSNNIRSAFKAKMKQGEYISPFAPYGYKICVEDNNKLDEDLMAADVVREIFNLYLSGLGFMAIAKYLNDNNVPSPSFYKFQKGIKLNVVSSRARNEIKWSASAIKKILTNEVYLGHLIQGKRTTVSYKNHKIKNKLKEEWIRCENTHKAIIDKDVFEKVNEMMKERTKACKKNGLVHIFSGKVFCLECGSYMRKKNSGKYDYLVCSNSCGEYNDCDNKHSIRYDMLEDIILNKINDMVNKYYNSDIVMKNNICNNKNNINYKIEELERQKIEVENQRNRIKKYLKSLYEDKVDGVVSLEQFKILIKDYKCEEDKWLVKMRLINDRIEYYKNHNLDLNINNEFFEDGEFKKINKFIVDEFIYKICIGKLDKISEIRNVKIEWNF